MCVCVLHRICIRHSIPQHTASFPTGAFMIYFLLLLLFFFCCKSLVVHLLDVSGHLESPIDFILKDHPLAFYDKGWTSELTFTWHESIIHLSDWRQHDWVPFPRALERRTGDVWDRRWWLLIRPQGQSIIFDKAKGVCLSPDRKLSATQKSTVIILSVTHCRHPGHLCFCFLNFFSFDISKDFLVAHDHFRKKVLPLPLVNFITSSGNMH